MSSAPITTWYYEFYESGSFPHQRELCEKIEWTKCNLEGQRLVNHDKLTGERANPLTIRLFGVREALNELDSEINQVSEKIKKQAEKQFSKGEPFELEGQRITSSSTAVQTGGAAFDKLTISGEEYPLGFPHVKAHLLLYELFSNFGSVLDRLAFEINLLYNLGVRRNVSLSKLVDNRPSYDKPLKTLRNKDTKLADLIVGFYPEFKETIEYRNRLVHDGIIRIETDSSFQGLNVMLAEDPNDKTSPMNVDAIDLCKKTKADILKLLDGSYELMLKYHENHGNPPW